MHGSFDATASLADYARTTKDVVQGNVYTPSLHELIDATTESHIYQVHEFNPGMSLNSVPIRGIL